MIKHFLATTALVAVTATGAFAQQQAGETTPVFQQERAGTQTQSEGFLTAREGHLLVSNLVGATVYTGIGDQAESIGEVADVIMGPDGRAEAVIVSVGGFLGVGEKDVAVPFNEVSWANREGGERWLTVDAGRQELESAPEFDRSALDMTRQGAMQQGQTAGQQQAAADSPVTGEPMDNQADADRPMGEEAAATQMAQAPADDLRADMTPVDQTGLRAEELIGATVYGAGDDDVGEVGDVILTTDGNIESFIVDVGGFLGIGEKEVAVGLESVEVMQDSDGEYWVFTPFTEAQFDSQVEFNEDTYQSDRDSVLLR